MGEGDVVGEAVQSLRRVLELVDTGEMAAQPAFVAQLRGAISALEAVGRHLST